jgi:hypothetical protein
MAFAASARATKVLIGNENLPAMPCIHATGGSHGRKSRKKAARKAARKKGRALHGPFRIR